MINSDNSVNDIRKTFIDYFKKNDHNVISSSNLVPENDPTLCLQMQEWFNLKIFSLV